MFDEGIEIPVIVQKVDSIEDAPGSNHRVDCLAHADTIVPVADEFPSAVMRERDRTDQDCRNANAGRSTSVIGKVSSTTAATTINAFGTPTASPSRP